MCTVSALYGCWLRYDANKAALDGAALERLTASVCVEDCGEAGTAFSRRSAASGRHWGSPRPRAAPDGAALRIRTGDGAGHPGGYRIKKTETGLEIRGTTPPAPFTGRSPCWGIWPRAKRRTPASERIGPGAICA
jgi:hypothetical protein